MSVLVLVVDDEPDVEALFRQQFRRDLRAQRFVMDFAVSAADALSRIADPIEQTLILILSDINMPGMTGLEMLPKVREMRPDVPITAARLVLGLARDLPHPEERREIAALHFEAIEAFEQLAEGLLVSATVSAWNRPSPPPPNGSAWWRETDLVLFSRNIGTFRTWRDVGVESAFAGKAEVGIPGGQLSV